ncbi:MAG: NUDIX domain-containing protein [Planctomycetota bacterium]
MAQIRAAGFVLYRTGRNHHLYLTLRNARHGDVGVPKGKAKARERSLEAALRETEEETGLGPGRIAPSGWFRRTVAYPFKGVSKEVVYHLAHTEAEEVTLSSEHESCAWLDLDRALEALRHDNLRGVLRDAAVFSKDPILRRGLTPSAARALLAAEAGDEAPVLRHSAQVAAMARALAEAWGGLDADYVEAAAWLHDIGRARTQGPRHPIEGFRLVLARGHAGYAAPCLSHYTKGRPHRDFGDLADEMWRACDLELLGPEERLIALADAMAAGERRVTLEERHADLCHRYGAGPFFDGMLDAARGLQREFEVRTGRGLYETAH